MNKGSYLYTVVFTFVISAAFTALLAATNAAYLPVIERNEELALKRTVLYVLGVDAADDHQVVQAFTQSVKAQEIDGSTIYIQYGDVDNILGYAVPMFGSGLWGTMRGYIGVSPDLSELLGLEFTNHNETPGLGGRIDEAWYKEQFRGLDLTTGDRIGHSDSINAITGATSTSYAVLRLVNQTVDQVLPQLEVLR